MPVFDPQTLAADCEGHWHGQPTVPVSGFSIDTRSLRGGDLFVAVRTGRRDGHDFLSAAASAGASGALVSRAVEEPPLARLQAVDTLRAFQTLARAHRRRFSGPVVGVTGSAGKTSTKDLLEVLLGEPGEVLATAGNLNNHLGVPLSLLRIDSARHGAAVIEAGINSPGEMDVLGAMIQPDVALVTTVAAAHLERLGSMAQIAEEKSRLAAHVSAEGTAVFPARLLAYPGFRDIRSRVFVAAAVDEPAESPRSGVSTIRYQVAQGPGATLIELEWEGARLSFPVRRLTPGMAANAVLAIIAALHLDVSADNIRRRFAHWRPAALRGEVIEQGGRVVYLDCYNANPASMLDALEGFAALAPASSPRLFVIGCMEELGTESASLHRALGASWPVRTDDRIVVFGPQGDAFASGVRTVHPYADVAVNPGRDEIAAEIRASSRALFVKGSRAYRLEELVQAIGAGAAEERETAA